MGHQHHHHHNDGASPRLNSPRFSGPMTRRAHSFKRSNGTTSQNNNGGALGTHHEIDVSITSPRSENAVSGDGLEVILEKRQQPLTQNQTQFGYLSQRRGLLRKPNFVMELGLKEKKKLGHWMFYVFCGLCLFMGVFKICANGWFGSAIERVESDKVGASQFQLNRS